MSVLPFFWVPSFFVAQKKHRSLHRRPTTSLVLLFRRKLLTSKKNGAKTPGKVVANHHGPPPSCNFSIFVFSHVHPFQVSSIPTCPNPPKQQKSILNQVAQQNPPSDCVSNPFFCEPPSFASLGVGTAFGFAFGGGDSDATTSACACKAGQKTAGSTCLKWD